MKLKLSEKDILFETKFKKLQSENDKLKLELLNVKEQWEDEVNDLKEKLKHFSNDKLKPFCVTESYSTINENLRWFDDNDINMFFAYFQKWFNLSSRSIFCSNACSLRS